MISGAIFDMDGVLVDNLEQHIRGWQQLGTEVGRELSRESIRRVFGQRNREMIASLFGHGLTDEESDRYAVRKEEIYRRIMAQELRPAAGLREFLADLRTSGMRLAVATSGPPENADLVVDGLNIRSLFDAIVTGADIARSKPDPEIFLLAARRIGVPPGRCVVFEDSTAGIEAALRAGSTCIALTTTHSKAELEADFRVLSVPDFTSLSAASLQQLSCSDV